MDNDVVVDIRVVYYRGRYRADTGWSKTGMGVLFPIRRLWRWKRVGHRKQSHEAKRQPHACS